MSAEVREAYETSEAIQATTAILAAQLSTLVTGDPPAEAPASPGLVAVGPRERPAFRR